MAGRKKLLQFLVDEDINQTEQAIALLWLYNIKQEYDERTVKELAQDFVDEGFPKPNTTRLRNSLQKDRRTIRGKGKNSFRVNPKFFSSLAEKYGSFIDHVQINESSSVIPLNFVKGTKVHIEQMTRQINGCYDYGFYDAVCVLLRRFLESLIIETYIYNKQAIKIKDGTVFKPLERLINFILNDPNITLSRNAPKNMQFIKDVGDTAAYDRLYITPKEDIDDNKQKIRCIINEMLVVSGIKK